jgi:vacuolar-type H+-ATPase subunit I/STV1
LPRDVMLATLLFSLLLPAISAARGAEAPQGKKEYLTESEADKIRDADNPSDRIKLYLSFADDRLKKFHYELTRAIPERRRNEMLNSLLNAYAGCIDDAADQIGLARERQADIHAALKSMKAKGKEYLEDLQKLAQGGAELEIYKDTLEDAIEATKDALTDVENAEKEMTPPPVRRKVS